MTSNSTAYDRNSTINDVYENALFHSFCRIVAHHKPFIINTYHFEHYHLLS